MKKLLISAAVAACVATSGAVSADEVKIGVMLGFTGPTESMAPFMATGAEMAIQEVSDSGKFMGGSKVVPVRGDSTCIAVSYTHLTLPTKA